MSYDYWICHNTDTWLPQPNFNTPNITWNKLPNTQKYEKKWQLAFHFSEQYFADIVTRVNVLKCIARTHFMTKSIDGNHFTISTITDIVNFGVYIIVSIEKDILSTFRDYFAYFHKCRTLRLSADLRGPSPPPPRWLKWILGLNKKTIYKFDWCNTFVIKGASNNDKYTHIPITVSEHLWKTVSFFQAGI